MKKFISVLLTIIVLTGVVFSVPIVTGAYTIKSSDGLYYYTIIGDKKAEFNGFNLNVWEENKKDTFEIPKEIDGYKITSIGNFYGDDEEFFNPEKIIIPDTVTRISDYAFHYYSDSEFNADENSIYFASNSLLEEIIIPESVVYIGDYAFKNCVKLKSVELSENLVYIGKGAFKNCKGLQKVIIPGTVKEIREETFYNCTELKKATIKDGIQFIGKKAFGNCTSLETIKLYDTFNSINDPNNDIAEDAIGYYWKGKKYRDKNIKMYFYEIRGALCKATHLNSYPQVNNIKTYYVMNNEKNTGFGTDPGGTAYLKISGKKVIRWESSKPSVVKISSNGKITGLKSGTTTITATLDNGTVYKRKIICGDPFLTCGSSIAIKKGQTKKVTIYGKADSVNNVYKSTTKAKIIGSVKKNYFKVKGLKKGETTLKITVNGKVLKLKVKVKAK